MTATTAGEQVSATVVVGSAGANPSQGETAATVTTTTTSSNKNPQSSPPRPKQRKALTLAQQANAVAALERVDKQQDSAQQQLQSKTQNLQRIVGPPAPPLLTKKSEAIPVLQKLIEPPQPQKRKKFPPKLPAPKQNNVFSQQQSQTIAIPSGENVTHSSVDNISLMPANTNSSQNDKVVIDGKNFSFNFVDSRSIG